MRETEYWHTILWNVDFGTGVRAHRVSTLLYGKVTRLPTLKETELQNLLAELAHRHKVPGATVSILSNGVVVQAATGVTSTNTGVEVTADTLFQIGSITKVYTTTLVMQLVDEGRVELDVPVRKYIPELRFADAEATESITLRQLLCHNSGIDGDSFEDTGRGDDCVRRHIETFATLPQLTPPGSVFSYANAGFIVAGWLVEKLTGQTWDAALKERVLGPLATRRTVTLPEEAILHRVAVGHIDPANSGEATPTPIWGLPRSSGPAGSVVSTATEVISFARIHIDGGITQTQARILSSDSAHAMQEEQVACLDKWRYAARGLGWALYNWSGRHVIGHDGGTIGQLAFLRVVPETGFAICLLTNALTGGGIYRDLFTQLFAAYAGIKLPDMPVASEGVEVEMSRFVGTYERLNERTEIEVTNGDLVASIEYGGVLKEINAPVRRKRLRPIDDKTFLIRKPGAQADLAFIFFDFDDARRPRYLHSEGRVSRRVS